MSNSDQESNNLIIFSNLAFRLMKREGISIKKAREKVAKEFHANSWETLLNGDAVTSNLDKYLESIFPLENANNQFLSEKGLDRASLWPTPVSLKKSILDATAPIRLLLKNAEIHDYSLQGQGTENKKVVTGFLVGETVRETKVSLYRPVTKTGDPRIWFSGLKNFCSSGQELAVLVKDGKLFVLNLSQYDYKALVGSGIYVNHLEVECLLQGTGLSTGAIELLERLKGLGIFRAPKRTRENKGKQRDTDVGMAVEAALGVAPNSSKSPDYKGIELKAWRSKHVDRHTLFVQIPSRFLDERVSSMQDFAALVGYSIRKDEVRILALAKRIDAKDLRCTVNALAPNAQNLMLRIDTNDDALVEFRDKENLLLWTGEKLRERLRTKHPETFWISCTTLKDDEGLEAFKINKVRYTHSPLLGQFLSLIEQGKITLDHLCSWHIVNKGSLSPKVAFTEKGPSFKIREKDLRLLFPDPIDIDI